MLIIIEEDRIELALHVIELKKAQMIKNNSKKSYKDLKAEIDILIKEKQEVYKQNEEVINKVLAKYLEEVKNN